MIDPLNIFPEIKNLCNTIYPNTNVYAFGSRTTGRSTSGKWDFDVLINTDEKLLQLKNIIDNYFSERIDENGVKVKVDLFNTKCSTIQELNNYLPNAILL